MNNLILPSASGATMSSREIAELTGKQHKNVVRDIRSMLGQLDKDTLSFERIYFDAQNREQLEFVIDRLHVECLLTGYSIPLRMKVLERLTELEQTNTPQLPNFSNPAEAARAWADEVEAKQAAVALIEQQKPAVEFVERYVAADSGSKGFRQVAKLLNANEKDFRAFLSDSKIMYKLGGEWMPYQCHADAGRFEVKGGVADNDHVYNSALFTPKGINWIAGLWAQHCLNNTSPGSTVTWGTAL